MSAIYVEGGGTSKDLRARCREGFRSLLEKCGFQGRMPKIVACGSRNEAFDDFCTAVKLADASDFIALLVDSEDPIANVEATWTHLRTRDGWVRPKDVSDEQALLMTTCMETWILVDRAALAKHFGDELQISALPAPGNAEARSRHEVQEALVRATKKCTNAYAKGKRSFQVLTCLDPGTLMAHLPSFVRVVRILTEKSKAKKRR